MNLPYRFHAIMYALILGISLITTFKCTATQKKSSPPAPQEKLALLNQKIAKLDNIIASYRKLGRNKPSDRNYKTYKKYEQEREQLAQEAESLKPKPLSTYAYQPSNHKASSPATTAPTATTLEEQPNTEIAVTAFYDEPVTRWHFEKKQNMFVYAADATKNISTQTILDTFAPNLGYKEQAGIFFDKYPGEGEDPEISPMEMLEIYFEQKRLEASSSSTVSGD